MQSTATPLALTTSREDFRALAAGHRVVPVTRKVLADSETPLSAYRKLAANRPGTFLLESAENGRSWSRWSFIGAGAPSALTVVDGQAHWWGSVPVGAPEGGDALEVRVDTFAQFMIMAGQKDRLGAFELLSAIDHLLEDARDVAAADPAGVDEDGELFGIESEFGARGELFLFRLKLKFRMDRYAADFYLIFGHAVIKQLSPRVFGGDQIEADLFASPPAPEPVTGVGYDRDQWNAVEQTQFAQHAPQKMLRHRVNRYDYLRTVFLEQLPHVSRSQPVKQTRFVRTETFDRPVVILHQMLVIPQQVVIKLHQLFGQQVRFFNRAGDVDQTFGRGESPQPVGDRGRGARMATSGFGGDDQKFFGGIVRHFFK